MSNFHPRNFWPLLCIDKLGGLLPVFILILSTGIEVLAIGYIGFLWSTEFRDSTLWRRIVVDSWFLGSVTLTALAIRLASSAQAVLCTSMLASLLLERNKVSLIDVCSISILRFINTGPHCLLRYGFSGFLSSWWSILRLESNVVLFLTITTFLLQFSSTILLRDTGFVSVAGFEHTETAGIGYGRSFTRTTYGANYWIEKPNNYFLFAEYLPKVTYTVPLNKTSISDSGPRQRAFLPFLTSENRSSIRDIKGDMMIIDQRSICVIPHNMSLELEFDEGQPATNVPRTMVLYMNAYAEFSHVDPQLNLNEWMPLMVQLRCNMPTENPESTDPRDELLGACLGLVFRNSTRTSNEIVYGLLVFQIKGDWNSWRIFTSQLDAKSGGDVQMQESNDHYVLHPSLFRQDGPLLTLDSGLSGGKDVQLSFTTCFTGLKFQVRYIEAHASRQLTENTMTWSKADERYNTERVRRQLVEPRGLAPHSSNFVITKPPAPERYPSEWHMSWIQAAIDTMANGTMAFCLNCTLGLSFGTNREHTTLVQDLLAAGAEISIICSAILTLVLQMAYYDRMVEYTDLRPFNVSRFVEALAPRRLIGFHAVTGIMAAHLLLVLGITFGFLGWTRASRIGAVWSAVSQLHKSEDFAEILDESSLMSDRKMERALGANGRRKVSLRVVPNHPFVEREAKFTIGFEGQEGRLRDTKKLIKYRKVREELGRNRAEQ